MTEGQKLVSKCPLPNWQCEFPDCVTRGMCIEDRPAFKTAAAADPCDHQNQYGGRCILPPRHLGSHDYDTTKSEPEAWVYHYLGNDPYLVGLVGNGYVVARHVRELFGKVDMHPETWRRAYPLYAGLTFAALREANVTRCAKWHPNGVASWSPSDWMTALTGELGELASLLKMRNRERDGLPGNKFSPTQKQVADELADVLTYLDLLAAALGVDLGHAVAEKFNEVSARVGFPDRIPVPKDAP